jgi:hypothetical protein
VRNTSARPGVDVAQLYVGLPPAGVDVLQPPRALKGFAKVALAPGQARRVTFALDERSLSYWNEAARDWKIAPGCYPLEVSRSSRDPQLRGALAVGRADCGPAAVRLPSGRGCTASAPRSSIASGGGLSASRSGVSLRGRTVDLACRGARGRGKVSAVEVAIAQRSGAACRWLDRRGGFGKPRSCSAAVWRRARLGRVRAGKVPWTFRASARLPRGSYLALVRGRDDGGAVERPRGRFNRRAFAVR